VGTFSVVAVLAVVGLWFFTRFATMFRISVRNGHVLVLSGGVPARLLQDIRVIVKQAGVERGTITATKGERGARLSCSGGIDERTEQRLRNVFALCTIAQLRHAPAIARPTLGQLLGVAWLAWLFEGATRRA
jgi:hypothetical protein